MFLDHQGAPDSRFTHNTSLSVFVKPEQKFPRPELPGPQSGPAGLCSSARVQAGNRVPTCLSCRPSHCPRAALSGLSLTCLSVWESRRAPVHLLSPGESSLSPGTLSSPPCPPQPCRVDIGWWVASGGWRSQGAVMGASCSISRSFCLRARVCWVGRLEPLLSM